MDRCSICMSRCQQHGLARGNGCDRHGVSLICSASSAGSISRSSAA
nr:MAG TPA: hypothetical protein [Caudoviricetes sp.]